MGRIRSSRNNKQKKQKKTRQTLVEWMRVSFSIDLLGYCTRLVPSNSSPYGAQKAGAVLCCAMDTVQKTMAERNRSVGLVVVGPPAPGQFLIIPQ
jgi:hypothetical protein